jgi:hypothetical protein
MIRIRPVVTLAMTAVLAAWVLRAATHGRYRRRQRPVSREQTVNLDDPYGGSTADESPAFGDAMLAADYGPQSGRRGRRRRRHHAG